MKKVLSFCLVMALLFGAIETAFAQEVRGGVTYDEFNFSSIGSYEPLPQPVLCPPTPETSYYYPEILEERIIIFIHGKPQIISIKLNWVDGNFLTTNFTTSSGEKLMETFSISSVVQKKTIIVSRETEGLIHFSYQDRSGMMRFIDFYIP